MPLNVFISHAAGDQNVAVAIRDWIRAALPDGVCVFVSSDGESIVPGDDWRARVEESLREADIILVVCTQYSVTRPWIGFEAGAGWAKGVKVIPLCYHAMVPANLPGPFSSRQALNLGLEIDQRRILALLAKDGGFDLSQITNAVLSLPARTEESDTRAPDVAKDALEHLFALINGRG